MSEGYAVDSKLDKDIQLQNLYLQDLAEARQILFKKQQDRNRYDLQKLRELLCPKLAYLSVLLKNNKTWILDQLFKQLQYRIYQKDQIICSIGEKSLEFYLILQGECSVMINLHDQKQNKQADQQSISMSIANLVEVKVLSQGMSFGERGLIENRGRTATIIAKDEVHMLILNKDSFMRILGTYEENKLAQIVNLLHSFEFFRKWGRGSLKWIYYNVLVKKCKLGEYIYQQGQQSENMYIIIEGDFSVTKSFLISNEMQDQNKTSKIYLKKCKNSKYFLSKEAEICVLSKGEIFGEDDLYLQQNRSYSIRSLTQDAILWVLSNKIFNAKILDKPNSVHYLENNSKTKIERYDQIYKQIIQNQQDTIFQRKLHLSPERIKLYKECFTQKADITMDQTKFDKQKEIQNIPNSLNSTNNYTYQNESQNIDMSIDYTISEYGINSKYGDSIQLDSLPSLTPISNTKKVKTNFNLRHRSQSISNDYQAIQATSLNTPRGKASFAQFLKIEQTSKSRDQTNLETNIESPNKISKDNLFIGNKNEQVRQNLQTQLPLIKDDKQYEKNLIREEDIQNNKTVELKYEQSKKKFYKESGDSLMEKIILNDKNAQRRNSKVKLNKLFNQLQYDKDVFQLQNQQRKQKDQQYEQDLISLNFILKGDYINRDIKFSKTELKQDLKDAIVIDCKIRSRSSHKINQNNKSFDSNNQNSSSSNSSYNNNNTRSPHKVSFSKNGKKNQFDNKYIFTLI
ncbi:hypothetical protein ABPG74_000723 [Tetrahymena malaccensis]